MLPWRWIRFVPVIVPSAVMRIVFSAFAVSAVESRSVAAIKAIRSIVAVVVWFKCVPAWLVFFMEETWVSRLKT